MNMLEALKLVKAADAGRLFARPAGKDADIRAIAWGTIGISRGIPGLHLTCWFEDFYIDKNGKHVWTESEHDGVAGINFDYLDADWEVVSIEQLENENRNERNT